MIDFLEWLCYTGGNSTTGDYHTRIREALPFRSARSWVRRPTGRRGPRCTGKAGEPTGESMKVLCTYCEMEGKPALIEEREPLGDPMVSHGVCAEHQRRLSTEMEVLRKGLAAAESRQFGRLPVSLRAVGLTTLVSGGQVSGTVRTIGVGGLMAEFPVEVPPGSLLRVQIARQHGSLEVDSRVVWTAAISGAVLHGLAFLTPKDPEFAVDLFMEEVRYREGVPGGPSQEESVSTGLAKPEYQKRRRVLRITLPSHPAAQTRATETVRLLDLSLFGARVEHLNILRPGTACQLELPAALGPLALGVQVVWSRVVGTEPRSEGERLLRYQSGLTFPQVTAEQHTILAQALEKAATVKGAPDTFGHVTA